jgi:hypothetical protein
VLPFLIFIWCMLIELVFRKKNRACNRVAHTLAKQVSENNQVGEWQLATSCVATLLTEDCNCAGPWINETPTACLVEEIF